MTMVRTLRARVRVRVRVRVRFRVKKTRVRARVKYDHCKDCFLSKRHSHHNAWVRSVITFHTLY